MLPRQNIMDRPPVTAWQAEVLRLTAFPDPTVQLNDQNWWMDIVGQPPEASISRAREASRQDEGPFEIGKLALRVQPGRIDWLLTALDDLEWTGENTPLFRPFPEALPLFLSLMNRWFALETCPPMKRLAFGANLLQPVNSQEAGYKQIAAYLPSVQLDVENSTDFLYQINRPRNSTSNITNLRINRLSKWNVITWRGFEILIGPTSREHLTMEQPACQLNLDINTAPDPEIELTREQLPIVFQELVDLGEEIAREGDIR